MHRAVSHHGVPIRLTQERWFHIVESHDDLAGRFDDVLATIEEPEVIFAGYDGALIAARQVSLGKHLLVVYREVSSARKQQLNRGWTLMNTDTGKSCKSRCRNVLDLSIHSLVLLGLIRFVNNPRLSAAIRGSN